jgi:hypothetical protein
MKLFRYAAVIPFLFLLQTNALADETSPNLNKVTLEFKAEQWVSTKTALVTIGINATLADKAFEKIHGDILNKLKTLSAQAEWHITGFNRTVDKSGLEQLQAQAVARIPETDIGSLRNQVKSVSKPGETYSVDDIQYSASDTEIRDVKVALRENIYQQINAEIARLNKDFPEQKYFLNDVNFIFSQPVPMVNTMAYAKVSGDNAAAAPSLSVSDKIQMNATVILASQLTNKA